MDAEHEKTDHNNRRSAVLSSLSFISITRDALDGANQQRAIA
jgi:hypothetical protein